MKLYFAGAECSGHYETLKECGVKRYLESYFALNGHSPVYQEGDDILLDSGAFSAKTRNVEIDINKYVDYLKKYGPLFTVYANLDVIGDGEGTDKNQKFMESKGLKPLPTYHMGEPKEYFEELVHKYDYIGLGGLVGSGSSKKMEQFFNYVFRYVIKNKLKTRFHGRGMTSPEFMKKFPFYSVDSTGWLSPGRFNRMPIFKNGELKGFDADYARRKWGVDFGKLHYKEKNKISVKAYSQLEEYVTNLHRVKGMEYRL